MSDFDDEDTWTETTRLTALEGKELPRSRRVFMLHQMTGPGAPNTFQLSGLRHILGRGTGVDIHIDAPDLSREHLLLSCKNDECHVKDLESRNGCFLNGVKIHSATLRDGDTLQLGKIIFTFHEGSQ
jgi:pSer/pThr/pTyr-binding forkhead associated (FHA) protein